MDLLPYQDGYAVMSKDLKGYSFKSNSLEDCKKYCHPGDVIVKKISKVCGFYITIRFKPFFKAFSFGKLYLKNILWIHWCTGKEYRHINGKIVFENKGE